MTDDRSDPTSLPAADNRAEQRAALRRLAEARLEKAHTQAQRSDAIDLRRALHELSVHEIELEMQNEELRSTYDALMRSRDRFAKLFEEAPVGFVTVDLRGRIERANRVAAALLDGGDVRRIRLRTLEEMVSQDDRPPFRRALTRVLQGKGTQTVELRLARERDQPAAWVSLQMALTVDDEAGPQCQVALTDIGERVRLEESRWRLAAIVESSDDAIVGRDLDGGVTSWNPSAERLFGWSADEMLGRTMDALVPEARRGEEAELLRRLRRGERIHHFDVERLSRDGSMRALAVSMSPVRDGHRRVVGSALIARDASQRRRADEALRLRVRQLALLSHTGQSLIMNAPAELPFHGELFERVREAVGSEIQLVYALDAEHGRLNLQSSYGLGDAQREQLQSVSIDDSLCGIAARRQAHLLIDKLDASELPAARVLAQAGARCYAGFPLIAHGHVYGVAAFASTSQDAFRESDVSLIRTVCDQVSAMLERTRLMDELREREQTLELADRNKNEFIATLAHELRNPLAPIRNAVSLMRHGDRLDAAAVSWCREIIDRQVVQMTHLLEDLFDVSRLSRHSVVLRRERIKLSRALDQALEATREVMRTRGHEVVVEIDEQPAAQTLVYADLTRLTQVFTNLLDNAAKYTDPGGRIVLNVQRDGDDHVRVTVRDSGIGIKPEFLPHVFDMFSQQAKGLERASGGLGIGLALSRGLVELHEGTLEASSAGAGAGSEFVVRLPAIPAEPPRAQPQAQPAAQSAPRLRVLVVDDNVDAAQTLGAVLEIEQQDVRTAYTATEALRIAREWSPEVAVLDIGLPDADGYALCRELRADAHRRGEAPPLTIACTGWGQEQDRERARDAGFDVHLVKPVDPRALMKAITRERAG